MSTGDIYEKMQNLSDQRGSTPVQIRHFYRHKGAIITYALFYTSIPVFSPSCLPTPLTFSPTSPASTPQNG